MRFLSLSIVTVALACSSGRDNQVQRGVTIPDSVFRYFEKRLIRNDDLSIDYDKDNRRYLLTTLSDEQMSLFTDPFYGNKRLYNAYFYSKQRYVGEILPILVYLDRDENSTLVLFCMSKDNEILERLEMTGGFSDFDGNDESNPVLDTYERYSEFLNDSSIRVTHLRHITERYNKEGETTRTDSVGIEYRIKQSGRIELVKKDSIRYSRSNR